MRSANTRVAWSCVLAATFVVCSEPVFANAPGQTGAELYQSGCAACHGLDGAGTARSTVGFETPLPDFTDCRFTTSEADVEWGAVVHLGGPARGFDRIMPAFGEALSREQIQSVIDHVRGFCSNPAWPHGNLNLPRPFATKKAFPENEVLASVAVPARARDSVETRIVYAKRLGARSEIELTLPFVVRHGLGRWNRGLGDVSGGFKHVLVHSRQVGSIVAAGADIVFPTGKETQGLGRRLAVFEPFATFGQMLSADAFIHVQGGLEIPLNIETADDELYWRMAVGKTFIDGQWGRAWSPIVELLGNRDLAPQEPVQWDVLPQLQVTLSRRQHVVLNAGVRIPMTLRQGRRPTVMLYALWDWFDGGLFDGWR